jgi:putative flippase GtrA
VAEWFKAAVLKTAVGYAHRGFESLPIRQSDPPGWARQAAQGTAALANDMHPTRTPFRPWRTRLRYLLANATGAAVDFTVAALVNALLSPPLWIAAGLGAIVGSVVNYLVHEFWTFGPGGKPTALRAVTYLTACLLVLVLRVGLTAGLEAGAGHVLPDLAILALAFVVTFLVNYVIAARLFRRGG